MTKEKHFIVKKEEKQNQIAWFLTYGYLCLGSARHLFSTNACFMFSGATLCHHSIELTLKAFCIWENEKYLQTHDLVKISEELSILILNDQDKELLKKIDSLFSLRYPQNSVEELGDDDLENTVYFYQKLCSSMPDEMSVLYKKCLSNNL